MQAAWARNVMKRHWRAIRAWVPSTALMPQHSDGETTPEHSDGEIVVYGCGHYGCVMPTDQPGIVLKLTTDPTEVRFVAEMLAAKQQPAGVVRYDAILELPETYRKRKLYLIWREDAYDVGNTPPYHETMVISYEGRVARNFTTNLRTFQESASQARFVLKRTKRPVAIYEAAKFTDKRHDLREQAIEYLMKPWRDRPFVPHFVDRYKGDARLALCLELCEIITEEMANEPFGYEVGTALHDLLVDGEILLADVHLGNIGKVTRPDYGDGLVVITDPGHAVFLKDRQMPVIPRL